MEHLASKASMPSFRFHPTDEELCMYYLKRKVTGRSFRCDIIPELDIYQYEPCDLPDMMASRTRDLCWYFFVPRSHKYNNGSRTNRSTCGGYWKVTGNDRPVMHLGRSVGKIRTLVFYVGKAPNGERTDWVMHEYRLDDADLAGKGVPQDAYVVAKLYKKSGAGPKNGEQYGAPYIEEEWEEVDYSSCPAASPNADQWTPDSGLTEIPNIATPPSTTRNQIPGTPTVTSTPDQLPGPAMTPAAEEEDIYQELLSMFTSDEGVAPASKEEDPFHGLPDLIPDWDRFHAGDGPTFT